MTQGKIIYAYDALCGWCYAMADVMKKAIDKYSDELDFEILSGGMVLGERAGKIGDKFDYINEAFKTVESHTGAKFGPKFLEELKKGDLEMSSLEPSKALTAIKIIKPEIAFEFAHSLQNALYFDGKSIKDEDVLVEIANNFSISEDEFLKHYQSEEVINATNEEFEFVSKLGISGFPTILFEKDGEYYLIARGFQHFMDLNNVLKKIIKTGEEIKD